MISPVNPTILSAREFASGTVNMRVGRDSYEILENRF